MTVDQQNTKAQCKWCKEHAQCQRPRWQYVPPGHICMLTQLVWLWDKCWWLQVYCLNDLTSYRIRTCCPKMCCLGAMTTVCCRQLRVGRGEIYACALFPWKPSTGHPLRKMPLCIWQSWLQHSVETEPSSQMHQPLRDRDLCFLSLHNDFQFKRKECQNGVQLMVLSGETWWNTCDHSNREVEAGRSGVQSHPWLHGKFKLSLDYLKSSL